MKFKVEVLSILACAALLGLVSACAKRFMVSEAGLVVDGSRGLEWAQDSGELMTWQKAKEHVQRLTIGGHSDWRLPTRTELQSLYEASLAAEFKIDPAFQLRHGEVWTSEQAAGCFEDLSVWVFRFGGPGGFEGWFGCGSIPGGGYYHRPFPASARAAVLAIRSR